jgi:hypothetical protein
MSSASKLYLKEIHEKFSYLATWLPNTNLKLGDVGVLQGEVFKQMTTLKALGVPFKIQKGKDKLDYTWTSKSGVTLKAKVAGEVAAGSALPLAEAGISIQFEKEGAFLFQAVGCIADEIEGKAAVGQAVLKLLKEKTWNPDWAVVDTLVRADCATIVVSNSGNAGLDLTTKAPVAALNLANLDAGLSVNSQSGDLIRFIAAKGLAPLFRLSRVKQSLLSKLLGDSGPITFGGVSAEDDEQAVLEANPLEAVAPM